MQYSSNEPIIGLQDRQDVLIFREFQESFEFFIGFSFFIKEIQDSIEFSMDDAPKIIRSVFHLSQSVGLDFKVQVKDFSDDDIKLQIIFLGHGQNKIRKDLKKTCVFARVKDKDGIYLYDDSSYS